MQGLRTFIHHTNPGGVSHPDTRAIMSAADAALDGPEPLIVPLVGKPGTGKTGLLEYWAGPYRQQERGIALDRQPVLLAEISQTERASLGRSVYTTSTACVTFSSIMYALGELSRQVDPPRDIPRWYREERSLYTDQQFLWLFDQVCREMRRLHVRAIVLDNAQHIDCRDGCPATPAQAPPGPRRAGAVRPSSRRTRSLTSRLGRCLSAPVWTPPSARLLSSYAR
jgi:hypothetical protein